MLVKRFTTKEEKKRVVAAIYYPSISKSKKVAFENRVNYIHENKKGLSINFAKGLATYLNSSLVDGYFRQFNGHTQVNVSDLKSIMYPTRAQLENIGELIGNKQSQSDMDELVNGMLSNDLGLEGG
ncbi:hypothetical protein D3C75_828810 [compost metagenome]